jgi:hypothetical protein
MSLGTAGYVQLAEVIAKQQPDETNIKADLFLCLHIMRHKDKHSSFDSLGLLAEVRCHVNNSVILLGAQVQVPILPRG